jgi:hypothetical protein
MPAFNLTTKAKERAKRIREARESVRERLARQEDATTIRLALKFGTESEAA